MFRIAHDMSALTALLREAFRKRLLYVGLQGSYLRGEADENSDIDVMAEKNIRPPAPGGVIFRLTRLPLVQL